MASKNNGLRAKASLGDKVSSLELHLSRQVFARGQQLSGVVLLRLTKPVSIKSLVVTVTGAEVAHGAKLPAAIRGAAPFFRRDVLLSGSDRSRFVSERLSQLWNAFLLRTQHRTLSAGEYTYPFSLPLPGSLPPSCDGKAGRIVYQVSARVNFPLGSVLQVNAEVPVAFPARESAEEPFVLSHSAVYGGKHATGADVSVELPGRSFLLGEPISGKLTVSNPRQMEMKSIAVGLQVCDGARAGARGAFQPRCVETAIIKPENPTAKLITTDFAITVPFDAPPSVEGTTILVTWSLNVTVEACPPLEFRVPVIIRMPIA